MSIRLGYCSQEVFTWLFHRQEADYVSYCGQKSILQDCIDLMVSSRYSRGFAKFVFIYWLKILLQIVTFISRKGINI